MSDMSGSFHSKEWHRIRELQQSLADAVAETERLRELLLRVLPHLAEYRMEHEGRDSDSYPIEDDVRAALVAGPKSFGTVEKSFGRME